MTKDKRFYTKAAISKLREVVTFRELYVLLYGESSPTKEELQTLRNRLNPNRSSLSLEFLGQCVQVSPDLHTMTLKEFLDLGEEKEG